MTVSQVVLANLRLNMYLRLSNKTQNFSVFVCVCVTVSQVVLANLGLNTYLRLALNSWSSYLYPPSACVEAFGRSAQCQE